MPDLHQTDFDQPGIYRSGRTCANKCELGFGSGCLEWPLSLCCSVYPKLLVVIRGGLCIEFVFWFLLLTFCSHALLIYLVYNFERLHAAVIVTIVFIRKSPREVYMGTSLRTHGMPWCLMEACSAPHGNRGTSHRNPRYPTLYRR